MRPASIFLIIQLSNSRGISENISLNFTSLSNYAKIMTSRLCIWRHSMNNFSAMWDFPTRLCHLLHFNNRKKC